MAIAAGGTVVATWLVTMRLPSLLLSSCALLALSTAACSIKLGDKTDGEKGTMTFAYDGPGCLFGCGLDRSALQGAQVSLTAKGGDPNVRQTARISERSIATVADQHQTCSCDSSSGSHSSSRTVEPAATCTSGETKSCSLAIDLETANEGDAKLEIVDPSGNVIDRVTVHVRPAARIDLKVEQGNGTKVADVYQVRVGDKVTIEAHAFDASGGETLFTKHGISHDYADTTVIGPDDSVLFGSSDVEDMVAKTPGDTTVKVYAPGAVQLVRFHVMP